jgi:ligand-binding sensor domain-containing protein
MKKILPLLFLITDCPVAFAQQKEFVFTKITKQSGLASSKVNSILKDHQGYYWIASDNGLQRYDGRNMLNFRNNPADTHSLPDNRVPTMMAPQRQQALYI